MSIKQEVQKLQVTAMKSKDKASLATARMIIAEINNAEIDARTKNKTLSEADVQAKLRSMVKSRLDSIALYEKAGEQSRVDAENLEIEIIKQFLPVPLSHDELVEIVKPIAEKIHAGDLKIGPAMGLLKKEGGERLDMQQAKILLDSLIADMK